MLRKRNSSRSAKQLSALFSLKDEKAFRDFTELKVWVKVHQLTLMVY